MQIIKGKYNQAHVMIDEIDDSTRSQIQDFVNNPSFQHSYIAIMPDCLHPDTEVLTTTGFMPIALIDNETKIASYDPTSRTYHFSKPGAKIIRPLRDNEGVFVLDNNRLGTLSIQTEHHRNAYIPHMGEICENLPNRMYIKDFLYSGSSNIQDANMPDSLLQFIVWVVGDGNIHGNSNKNPSMRIRFGLKKGRKIDRILYLCSSLGLVPHICTTSKQTTIELSVKDSAFVIRIVGVNKVFPLDWVSMLSTRQKLLVLEEAIQVDGDFEAFKRGRGFRLNSKRKADIDFFSALSVDIGSSSIVHRVTESNLTHKINEMYYLNILRSSCLYSGASGIHNSVIKRHRIEDVPAYVVCLQCDTGFFIYRFRGRTGVTGNCHAGKGSCIGFTMQMNDRIIPDVVGVDIGCGMLSCKFDVDHLDVVAFDHFIKENIPSGFSVNDKACRCLNFYQDTVKKIGMDEARVSRSIGTLGGGNHFIEAGFGSDGKLWVTIHSGSRNFGLQIAKYHGLKAKELCAKWGADIRGIPFLLVDSPEGRDYIHDQLRGTQYAADNRGEMMNRITSFFGEDPVDGVESRHNFIDESGMIRKGATSAHEGERLIIPFNMRDGLALCVGKGNKRYNYSAPHGAGRILSRSRAKAELDVEYFQQDMKDAGVYTSTANASTLDEAPDAYKDMRVILENIKETVDVIEMVKPVYNFKASGE